MATVVIGTSFPLQPVFSPTIALGSSPMAEREVIRCDSCSLVQFKTINLLCRRCHKPLEAEEPAVPVVPAATSAPPPKISYEVVANPIRHFRQARHLSQKHLAALMQVPRTYVSKIENGKAIPTLGSLQRFAIALGVDIRQLFCDPPSVRAEEVSAIFADPFLAEFASLLPSLSAMHRAIVLSVARECSMKQQVRRVA